MVMSVEQATAALTQKGAQFETETRVVNGVEMKVWKNAPPTLRAVLELSRGHGNLPFLVYEDDRLTFAEHYAAAAMLAHRMRDRFGIEKGDRVAIAMRNFPEWVEIFWAVTAIGAIVVPLNAWFTGGELTYCLKDSGTVLLFADAERIERLAPEMAGLGLRATIAVRVDGALPPGVLRFEEVLGTPDAGATLPAAEIDPEDEATIFYTSGTTGKPKGALGTHRNFCTNLINIVFTTLRNMLQRGDPLPTPDAPKKAYLLSVPLFHVTGCHSVMGGTILLGAKLVLMRKWDPEEAMRLIEREKVTAFGGVPSMAWQVMESPNFAKHDLSTVESIGYGGAPAAPARVERSGAKFPKVTASNGYGLTETSSLASQNAGVNYQRKPDSVGLPVPVNEMKVVNEKGEALPAREVGELWIKGPNVVKGYWNKPEATAAAFTEGWLHTGDLAWLDEEGFIYIVDRAKDMLIRAGENIYCIEVEDALYSHPAVMDAGVIGLPHRVLGEEVGAVVQIKPGERASEEALRNHLKGMIAAFKIPVRIVMLDTPLPRNANGKILKRELLPFFADPAVKDVG